MNQKILDALVSLSVALSDRCMGDPIRDFIQRDVPPVPSHVHGYVGNAVHLERDRSYSIGSFTVTGCAIEQLLTSSIPVTGLPPHPSTPKPASPWGNINHFVIGALFNWLKDPCEELHGLTPVQALELRSSISDSTKLPRDAWVLLQQNVPDRRKAVAAAYRVRFPNATFD